MSDIRVKGAPWELEPWDDEPETLDWYRVLAEDGSLVAKVCRVPPTCYDHARLIVHAPHLWQALKWVADGTLTREGAAEILREVEMEEEI